MKKFLLFPLLLFLTNLNAQKPIFINNHFNPSKNKRIEIGIMGQGVIQDFLIGFGAYLKCNLVETLYYNLDINGELYPSLMYAGYMIGGGGKIGIRNHFRLFKGNGISIGLGKNVRSTFFFCIKKD